MHIDEIRRRSLEYAKGHVRTGDVFRGPRKKKKRSNKRQQRSAVTERQKYHAYINSKEWLAFREKIFAARGRKCERCQFAGKGLQLHHLTYARFGKELPADVEILCKACHFLQHPEYRGPRKVEKTEAEVVADWFALSLAQEDSSDLRSDARLKK